MISRPAALALFGLALFSAPLAQAAGFIAAPDSADGSADITLQAVALEDDLLADQGDFASPSLAQQLASYAVRTTQGADSDIAQHIGVQSRFSAK